MTTNIFYKAIIFLAASLACLSCSQDVADDVVSTDSEGTVRIVYKIDGATATRETEDGWTGDWNENKISSLDLFVFKADGTVKHEQFNVNVENASQQQQLEPTTIKYSDIADASNTCYLIANRNSVLNINSLDDLKAAKTGEITANAKQDLFIMDAVTKPTVSNNVATLDFKLKRAAAKIRVTVNGASIDQCQMKLCNYVKKTSYLEECEMYCKDDESQRVSGDLLSYSDLSRWTNENDVKAVFYSYPNDWFNESKLDDTGSLGSNYASDDLVDELKQTYILLKAPFGGTDYYYKVPVNYLIDENNDQAVSDVKALRDNYYRILRNHFYDVTVTIDREGGPIDAPVTPTFQVKINDWTEGDSFEIEQSEFEQQSQSE